jgi:hypothetical protein
MALKFEPVIRKARFHVPGYTPQQMNEMAEDFILESIRPRIRQALDVNDKPVPPLAKNYAKRKQKRRGLNPVRDWTLSGNTLKTLSVLVAGHNTATIGFVGPIANRRAYINNARYRQFGVSPSDSEKLTRIRAEMERPVRALAA